MTPFVLIPLYNHGHSIREVVLRTLPFCPRVLVVDDGSTDNGLAALRDLNIHSLRLAPNQGKGQAILTGAKYAATLKASHIITLDADGQHYPEDLPILLEALSIHPHDCIIGRRDFSGPFIPAASRFGRAFSSFWMKVETGCSVSDMQSGYRVYPLEMLLHLPVTEKGYAFEVEILVRAAWAGFVLREVDVRVFYPPKGERISHFHGLRDNFRLSLLNFRLTLRALTPLPFHQYSRDTEEKITLRHPLRSLALLLKDKETPKNLAVSAGLSVAISSLPFIGLQSILLLTVINSCRVNRICALAMIPLTWPPFVPGLAVLLGYRLRNGTWLTDFSLQTLGYEACDRLLDWIVGSLCLAPCAGLIAFLLVLLLALGVRTSLGVGAHG